MTSLFYHPDISAQEFELLPEEAQHILKAKRLRVGDTVHLTDGKGSLGLFEIVQDRATQCIVRKVEMIESQLTRTYKIHLCIAPTKNISRIEWMLEKCTEIGLDTLTFVQCKHSERAKLKTERLEKIAISALKQSKQVYLPSLSSLLEFKDFVKQNFGNAQKFIAYVPESSTASLFSYLKPQQDVLILVGPEGDFSPDEIDLALKNGFQSVSLGNTVLRTETAGLVACHTCHLKNQI
jgi:16S rRNA (uracil1498-N3)-methyltransferase